MYSYNLFPRPLVITGYILIFLAVAAAIYNLNSLRDSERSTSFGLSAAFFFIGLVMISFRSKIVIDESSEIVIKESGLPGITLSREKIKIPMNCTGILIKQRNKRGTGYYRLVLPVSYNFNSFDMFFISGQCFVRLINTDYNRAIKIAGFLKSNLKLGYVLEKQT